MPLCMITACLYNTERVLPKKNLRIVKDYLVCNSTLRADYTILYDLV